MSGQITLREHPGDCACSLCITARAHERHTRVVRALEADLASRNAEIVRLEKTERMSIELRRGLKALVDRPDRPVRNQDYLDGTYEAIRAFREAANAHAGGRAQTAGQSAGQARAGCGETATTEKRPGERTPQDKPEVAHG